MREVTNRIQVDGVEFPVPSIVGAIVKDIVGERDELRARYKEAQEQLERLRIELRRENDAHDEHLQQLRSLQKELDR